jgi:hypothetical protein
MMDGGERRGETGDKAARFPGRKPATKPARIPARKLARIPARKTPVNPPKYERAARLPANKPPENQPIRTFARNPTRKLALCTED